MPLPDASEIATYGGPKRNYEIAPVDKDTDLDANEYNKLACDVAMASRIIDRCEVHFTGGTSPSVTSFEAVWKKSTSTVPTIAHTATGTYTITFPLTVEDELEVEHAVNLKSACAWSESSTPFHVQASAAGNVITVYVFDMAGAAVDGASIAFTVRAR